MKNTIILRVYKDNTIEIIPHPYYPNPNKTNLLPKNPYRESTYIESSYMSSREYSLLLKRRYRELFSKQLSLDNPYFFTLTLRERIPLKQLNIEFHKFIVYVNRKVGKPEYLRAFEFHNKGSRLHIHTLLSFRENPTNFTKEYIEKYLWKLGSVHFKRAWSPMGVLEYCTTYKKNDIQKGKNKGLTYFPKGTKIISMSENFVLSDKEYEEQIIDKKTFYNLLSQKETIEENGGFMRVDEHFYFNEYYQEIKECMDRVFIRLK